MERSRSSDPRLNRAAPRASSYPYDTQRPAAPPPPPTYPPQRTSSSIYPYETQEPRQQPPQQVAPPPRLPAQRRKPVPVWRRLLGIVAFLALTAVSVPVHILAVFFAYVEFESPGDTATAVLLVSGAFLVCFVALLVTGTVTQLVGAFPGRWRARITFAALAGLIAIGIAYYAALTRF